MARPAMHPAIARALAAFPARVARRGEASLSVILRDRLARDGASAWGHGNLTGDGFPLELSFTTGDDRLRYTAEPASASTAPGERLDTVLRILRSLRAAVPTETVAAFRDVQRSGPLSYGAWLGARHGADGDQCKIYVEVPAEAPVLPGFRGPRLSDRAVTPKMIAYCPDSRTFEAYYGVHALSPQHLPRLLGHVGLESRAFTLAGWLERAYGHRLRDKLPGPSAGLSYAMSADGAPRAVTLFLVARCLWGSDARIRRSFVAAARELGADTERYCRVTASLEQSQLWTTRHGLVGLTLGPSGAFALNVGVRPE